jgi:acyl-CoA synthetase (AMP-forming)/AMP-acid ligase II
LSLRWIRERLEEFRGREALIEGETTLTYDELIEQVDQLAERFRSWGVTAGDCFAFMGDYSIPNVTRFVTALVEGLVAVPIAVKAADEVTRALEAVPRDWYAGADCRLDQAPERILPATHHPLLEQLRERRHPGIIILSSGSTGTPKVVLQDASMLLERFRHPRNAYRSLVFLLPDHIGGVNNLFSMLTCGSTLVIPKNRTPEEICELIESRKVSSIPVTPTFLNLLLISGAHKEYDLSSLKVISYATEVMPQHTLEAATKAFPGVRFVQIYGSSELGVFRCKSKDDASAFVSLKGDGVELQVREGRLWVKGMDSMLGYLSGEPSGFDEDGWYDTGDVVVEQDGYYRFLGRASELINVGGQKVYPTEVESALMSLDGVLECSVFGEQHVLTGQVVAARVKLSTGESARAFKRRMRQALAARLESFKIPVVVTLGDSVISQRFKKMRRLAREGEQ